MSRKKYSIINLATSSASELLIMILKFATRTVFIYTLGKSYLGINGLFTNILQVLSLTELGLARALNFRLYKPLADQDFKRIRVLLKFYKLAYRIIGLTIMLLGIILIPFLPSLISDYDRLEVLGINAVVIFLLYLAQNVSTYLFAAYKSALIKADQKEYRLTVASYGITIATYCTQMLILYFLHSFILYTASLVLFNILQNIINAFIVNHYYPYIKEYATDKLSKEEVIELLNDCYALFIYKINQVVLNATDNIVLSAFIGLEIVGMYSNYMMIYNQIKILMIRFFNAIKASMGNLHATESIEKQYVFFKALNFITVFTYGTAAVTTYVAGDAFIHSWIGNDYVIGGAFCLLLGIEVYILGIRQFMSSFRNTMGLFQQGKYRPLAGIIINIFVSVALVKPMGIAGVMLGTIISDCLTMIWYDPLVLYKYGFQGKWKLSDYFVKNLFYILTLVVAAVLTKLVPIGTNASGWIPTIAKMAVSVMITCSLLIITNIKTEEMAYLISSVKGLVFKRKRKK